MDSGRRDGDWRGWIHNKTDDTDAYQKARTTQRGGTTEQNKSVAFPVAKGLVIMPGTHCCNKICEGCRLRFCCSYCAPDRREGKRHLCQHCDALSAFMITEQVRREVHRILRAHAAKLERAATLAMFRLHAQ